MKKSQGNETEIREIKETESDRENSIYLFWELELKEQMKNEQKHISNYNEKTF